MAKKKVAVKPYAGVTALIDDVAKKHDEKAKQKKLQEEWLEETLLKVRYHFEEVLQLEKEEFAASADLYNIGDEHCIKLAWGGGDIVVETLYDDERMTNGVQRMAAKHLHTDEYIETFLVGVIESILKTYPAFGEYLTELNAKQKTAAKKTADKKTTAKKKGAE